MWSKSIETLGQAISSGRQDIPKNQKRNCSRRRVNKKALAKS